MKRLIIFFLITLVFVTYSCKHADSADVDKSKMPVVVVKGKTLYKLDLDNALPLGLSTDDSIAAAKAYIDMWINDQLMYEKAKQNILNKSEIETLIEDYKKSLVTNAYQEQLLKEHFSQSLSESEIKSYYEQNKEKFQLSNNLIKGLYLKIPLGSAQLDNFRKWYKQGTDDAIGNIEKNYLQNTVAYDYFYDKWIDLEEVTNNIPVKIADEKQFLKTNKNLETRDSSFVYLLNIKEYKLSGSEAPLEYIKGSVSKMFIEHKKADYLKQVKKDLYDKAVSDNEIKFYDK